MMKYPTSLVPVAVFGALLAQPVGFINGVHVSLMIAAAVAIATAAAARTLSLPARAHQQPKSAMEVA